MDANITDRSCQSHASLCIITSNTDFFLSYLLAEANESSNDIFLQKY